MSIAGIVATALLPVGRVLPYAQRMDKQKVSRRVAEANRLLVEGRRTADRQRDLIARLELIGIDSTKQRALLTILVEAYADREERLVQLLDWLQSQPERKADGQQSRCWGRRGGPCA